MKLNLMNDIYLNGMIDYVAATLLSLIFSRFFYKDFATTLQVFININISR
jgi:hypothetical protein